MQIVSKLSRKELRRTIRQQRKQLSQIEAKIAADIVADKGFEFVIQNHAQHIALYLPFDGEIATESLISKLWLAHKKVYIPVLDPNTNRQLLFVEYTPNSQMITNRLGILEPCLTNAKILPISELEIMFMPLVACDKQGNRLGMGGGFYDYSLQHKAEYKLITVGLAYSCQQVDELPVESWDIPLDHIFIA